MALGGPPRSYENELPQRLFSRQCVEGGMLRSSQRVGSSEKLASLGPFIVNSSTLAMVMVGWVYLLSSSYSFPELLVGFPRAHPSHLLYFSGECVEDKFSEVRRGVCLPFAFR